MNRNLKPTIAWEIACCLDIVYQILDDLEDVRLALEKGCDPHLILHPPFDPFKTIGKYL
jgi:hypothetical protein